MNKKMLIVIAVGLTVTIGTVSEGSKRNWRQNPFAGNINLDSFIKKTASDTDGSSNLSEEVFTQSVNLQGIWQSGNSVRAMINDTSVKNGDRINNFLVMDIERTHVKLKNLDTGLIDNLELH